MPNLTGDIIPQPLRDTSLGADATQVFAGQQEKIRTSLQIGESRGRNFLCYYGKTDSAVAVRALGHMEWLSNPADNTTVIFNGVTFTFKNSPVAATDVQRGVDLSTTIGSLVAVLAASVNPAISVANYTATPAKTSTGLDVLYLTAGLAGNAYTLGAGTSGATPSGATLTGGLETPIPVISVPTNWLRKLELVLAINIGTAEYSVPTATQALNADGVHIDLSITGLEVSSEYIIQFIGRRN